MLALRQPWRHTLPNRTLQIYQHILPPPTGYHRSLKLVASGVGYLGDLNGFPEGVVSTRWEFGLYRSEESTSNKPSTSGLSRDKVRPADGGGKPPRGVFDLTSDDDSTDIEFPAWEPSSDLNVVKYRHDNIELVSKSSASKMKRKM
uniref:Uncharacterized protein n=1 Tax=Magallana gigas TaxID=29159 RepID=K1Q7T9_MAGGI